MIRIYAARYSALVIQYQAFRNRTYKIFICSAMCIRTPSRAIHFVSECHFTVAVFSYFPRPNETPRIRLGKSKMVVPLFKRNSSTASLFGFPATQRPAPDSYSSNTSPNKSSAPPSRHGGRTRNHGPTRMFPAAGARRCQHCSGGKYRGTSQ